MYQNYNYYPQQQQPQSKPINYGNYLTQVSQPAGLKGRPVSSIEEARASSIDFDGSIFYFPDLANRRIYTKQINIDGTATLNMYEFKELPMSQPTSTSNNFVTRDEFESAIAQLKTAITPANAAPQTAPPQAKKLEVMEF